MEHVAQAFEALGVVLLATGAVLSFFLAGRTWRRTHQPRQAYALLRQAFGGTLLLGLEVLVAADLVRTIAVAPSLSNVLNLGIVVVIRTFLSFSLETEIDGVPPWRRRQRSGADAIAQASRRPPDQPCCDADEHDLARNSRAPGLGRLPAATTSARRISLLSRSAGRAWRRPLPVDEQTCIAVVPEWYHIAAKAAALMHSLACHHALLDGNKRLALLAAVVFLRINGYRPALSDDEAFDLNLGVAAGQLDSEEIEKRLRLEPVTGFSHLRSRQR